MTKEKVSLSQSSSTTHKDVKKALKDKKTKKTPLRNKTHQRFPIVGIGASAGGLAAFEAFFSGMPVGADPDMAFVLVQHLAPDHKSILTELIQRYTRMQVFEVEDGMVVQPNCTYIIPPNHDMVLVNGKLQLMDPSAPRWQRLPIDFFFQSLAQDQQERAIGIVLSGTGSDGTLGVRAIKEKGGMIIVQNPLSTEHDGMPRNAIGTGLADYIISPAEMPTKLINYVTHAFIKSPQTTILAPEAQNALNKIFTLLRIQTDHDFSQYKSSTIHRRIERRMAVHQIDTIDRYVKYLQKTPVEVEALFREFIIGVTNFFRDPDAFKALEEQVIPKLFTNKQAGASVRVWVPGCSTGEEAYSIAILLQEQQEKLKQDFKVQVFATDIDSQAIATARAGLYPSSIATDISPPKRLKRFFTAEHDGNAYRINKSIRDKLIFSEHDVIKDPPFSKLDLISCRNLLIYMGGDLQKKVIPFFYYALSPGGFLFLGTSETISEFGDLFTALNNKLKLFQRRENFYSSQRTASGRFLPSLKPIITPGVQNTEKAEDIRKLPLRELTERALLQHHASIGMLVDGHGDILYFHGHTGQYLEPPQGEAGVNNILKMAREGLRRELTKALHKAVSINEIVHHLGLRINNNGQFITVNLTVRPMPIHHPTQKETPLYLVIIEETPTSNHKQAQQTIALHAIRKKDSLDDKDTDTNIMALKKELRAKEEYLQITNEELETSNEELKSSNEELQSVNEELQSTNEELETSKEELQSVNEELATVNTELQTKVTDLTRINNDMNNLLGGTGIGTIFVDLQLRILRFTPTATQIINLILSDVGRPVGHIVSNLVGYDSIVKDTQAVLDKLIPKEVEVQTQTGAWYQMRIQPYRTTNNVIEGAVITFIDITRAKKAQEELEKAHAQTVAILQSTTEGILGLDTQGNLVFANSAAVKIIGYTTEELIGKSIHNTWHHKHADGSPFPVSTCPIHSSLGDKKSQVGTDYFFRKDGTCFLAEFTKLPTIINSKVTGAVISFRDITDRRPLKTEQGNDWKKDHRKTTKVHNDKQE
jgi:two-component system CheB/CheR fusion protein